MRAFPALISSLSGLWLVSCGSDVTKRQPLEAGPPSIVGAYDPHDGLAVRWHDLTVKDEQGLGYLARTRFPFKTTARRDAEGHRIVAIRSTGAFAAGLEGFGLLAGPHVTDGPLTVETAGTCGSWDTSANTMYPSYDYSPEPTHHGISNEISTWVGLPNVAVRQIATTANARPVWAIRVGTPSTTTPVPTVYFVGTHHAREWASTEVVLQLARFYVTVAANIQGVNVVFVPVVNPDGYQYSHTGFRDQRKNRNPTCNVDLNRNYATAWNAAADSGSTTCSSDEYRGPSAASEAETVGIQTLLNGTAFAPEMQVPVVTVDTHTYADDAIYSDGYKATTNGQGPACAMLSNCANPDTQVIRSLFGTAASPQLQDSTYPYLPGTFDYTVDIGNAIGYTTSGDVTVHANFKTSTRSLAITPELTGRLVGFHIECEATHTAVISSLVSQYMTIIGTVTTAAAALATTSPAGAYAPPRFGQAYAYGAYSREKTGGKTNLSARPVMLMGFWAPTDTIAPKSIASSGGPITASPRRQGAQYNMYSATFPSWSHPATWIGASPNGPGVALTTGDLSIDNWPHSANWIFHNAPSDKRGGAQDYWYEPTPTPYDTVLDIPSATFSDPSATNAFVSFSVEWSETPGQSAIELQRFSGGTWRTVSAWPLSEPHYEIRSAGFLAPEGSTRIRSYRFELTPSGGVTTEPYRFLQHAGASSARFKLFDLIVGYRYGLLP